MFDSKKENKDEKRENEKGIGRFNWGLEGT